MKLAAAFFVALAALAQGVQDMSPIHGTVAEYGTGAPISAAEVILYEFVSIDGLYTRKPVATVVTDSRGAFTLKPEHPGQFFSEAKKPTYLTAEELDSIRPIPGPQLAELALTLTLDPIPDIHFILIRPGGLTGRVIDEDGRPVANLPIQAVAAGVVASLSTRAVTDRDGVFLLPTLVPAPRVVRVGPLDELPITRRYIKEEVEKIDQDYEIAYWPGGTPDPAPALALPIIPGAVANAGTIRVRKVPYYRAHLTFANGCPPKTSWIYSKSSALGIMIGPCAKDAVLDKLRPGLNTIGVVQENTGWTILQFSIDRENVEVPVNFTPLIEVPGRFTAAKGSALPDLAATRIALRPVFNSRSSIAADAISPKGDFTIQRVAWPQHQVQFPSLSPAMAVKEIRYNGFPVTDGVINVASGALLEIIVDDQPASISGTAPPQSTVYLARWPFVAVPSAPFQFTTRADAEGKFQIPSLAEGEYRILSASAPPDAGAFSAAQKVTLGRGELKSVELKSR
jgi:hypothetical protein